MSDARMYQQQLPLELNSNIKLKCSLLPPLSACSITIKVPFIDMVNNWKFTKNAKSPSDAKRDRIESEIYGEFLSTELSVENET
jgi:hypothetical protein